MSKLLQLEEGDSSIQLRSWERLEKEERTTNIHYNNNYISGLRGSI